MYGKAIGGNGHWRYLLHPFTSVSNRRVLTISRRYELLKWAEEQDSFVLEDDYDSELQYYTKPIPALQSIDNHDRVIYFGTFSKALSPSIRMGYMILPKRLLEKYHQLFNYYNSTVPLLNQYVIGSLKENDMLLQGNI